MVSILLFHPSASPPSYSVCSRGAEGLRSSNPQCALLLLLTIALWGWYHIVLSSKKFTATHCAFLVSADVNVSLPEPGSILILPILRLMLTLLLTL